MDSQRLRIVSSYSEFHLLIDEYSFNFVLIFYWIRFPLSKNSKPATTSLPDLSGFNLLDSVTEQQSSNRISQINSSTTAPDEQSSQAKVDPGKSSDVPEQSQIALSSSVNVTSLSNNAEPREKGRTKDDYDDEEDSSDLDIQAGLRRRDFGEKNSG